MFRFSVIIILLFVITSCSIFKAEYYFPKYHITAFYSSVTGTGGATSYLNWGDKLTYLNKSVTNKNKAGQAIVYLKVKNSVDNSIGFVDEDSVEKNPVSKGVILNPAIVYDTPTVLSRDKQSVDPPVLAYIIDIKDNEWAKIDPYNAPLVYSLSVTQGNSLQGPAKVIYPWVYMKDISTNSDIIDFVIALQIAVKKYNEAKKAYDANPNEKNLQIFQASIKPERDNIINIMKNKQALSLPVLNGSISNIVYNFLNATDFFSGSNIQDNESNQTQLNQNTDNSLTDQL